MVQFDRSVCYDGTLLVRYLTGASRGVRQKLSPPRLRLQQYIKPLLKQPQPDGRRQRGGRFENSIVLTICGSQLSIDFRVQRGFSLGILYLAFSSALSEGSLVNETTLQQRRLDNLPMTPASL